MTLVATALALLMGCDSAVAGLELLIGVKSAVVQGAAGRQLIRETWGGAAALHEGVRVVFLGCEPDFTDMNESEASRVREAVTREKATYRDLLTHELQCTDSYFRLVDKIKGFFRWIRLQTATTQSDLPQYVMLTDMDVFVNIASLLDDVVRSDSVATDQFYAGDVVQTVLQTQQRHIRDPTHKNYVSFAESPLGDKPHYASGPHYVLSGDLVAFFAKNVKFLRGLGTLEDASVALWASNLLGVRPVHLPRFRSSQGVTCNNRLIAYGDLTSTAIARAHSNLIQNRSMCEGYSFSSWDQLLPGIPIEIPALQGAGRRPIPLSYKWEMSWHVGDNTLIIKATVSSTDDTAANPEPIDAFFYPAGERIGHFCLRLLDAARASMPQTELRRGWCDEVRDDLREALERLATAEPPLTPSLAMARQAIQSSRLLTTTIVMVQLTRRASKFRPLIETLVSQMYPEVIIYVSTEEGHRACTPFYVPDLIVATFNDVLEPRTDQEYDERYPDMTRIVIISTKPHTPASHQLRDRTILISSTRDESVDRHLYVPIASLSFIDQRRSSPQALLKPTVVNDASPREDVVLCPMDTTATSTLAATANASIALRCPPSRTSQADSPAFPLDDDVDFYRAYKFGIVFEDEDAINVPGYVSHTIVSAFLAGSVPVYLGHSPTVKWLFNPHAFVDCGSFDSIVDCVDHVRMLLSSPELYESMRREAAVVNMTAFTEAFSWHPDALAALAEGTRGVETVAERLTALVNSA